MTKIRSFVFFDIETTGLPFQERNQTKIIELSCVAIQRQDLLNTAYGNIPPVTKLTYVLNPQKTIPPIVVKLTGISNKIVERAPIFSQKFDAFVSFIKNLSKPVCLVAHNGNSFDYKILLAECNDAHKFLPQDLLCVDSLVGFRLILKGSGINHEKLILEELMTDDDDEDLWPEFDISHEEWEEIDTLSQLSSQQTGKKNAAIRKVKVAKKPKTKNSNHQKEVFDLSTVYKRLLNKEVNNAHRAEVDCMMLLECVVAIKKNFVPWADQACQHLNQIQPLIR